MEIILTSLLSLLFVVLSCRQIFKNRSVVRPDAPKTKIAPYVMLLTGVLCVADSLAGGDVCTRLPFIILTGLTSLYIMVCPFLPYERIKWVLWTMIVLQVALLCLYVGVIAGYVQTIPSKCFVIGCVILSCMFFCLYVYGVWSHLHNLKNVLRSGSAWLNVNICVDSVYSLLLVVYTVVYLTLYMFVPLGALAGVIATLLYASMAVALMLRLQNDSLFVLWTDHERVIVESMRITYIDAGVQENAEASGETLLYKSIYDRVLEHFKENKPYLDSSLTINDVATVVFSNRLYISKAISQFGGRNFCQFVNYYRIVHALELFRENPEIKIAELAVRSGFNTSVSFGMAFNLFMGQKPGDWCRRERYRMDKLKK